MSIPPFIGWTVTLSVEKRYFLGMRTACDPPLTKTLVIDILPPPCRKIYVLYIFYPLMSSGTAEDPRVYAFEKDAALPLNVWLEEVKRRQCASVQMCKRPAVNSLAPAPVSEA
jgi:hypothetical protein